MASRAPIDLQEPIVAPPGIRPAQAPPRETGFLENFSAGAEEMLVAGNTGAEGVQMATAYGPLIDALHQAGEMEEVDYSSFGFGRRRMPFDNPFDLTDHGGPGTLTRGDAIGQIWGAIRRRRSSDRNFLPGVPDTAEAFAAQVRARNAAQLARIRETQSGATRWGQVGGFLGGAAGSLVDPTNLLTLPVGGGARTVIGSIARSAIENMIVEAVSEPLVAQRYHELGEDLSAGDMGNNVLMAGAGGAGLHGALHLGGAVTGRALQGIFNTLPESVQRRWSAAPDDVPLADILRATVPEEHWTPEARAAVNVLEREQEVASASPYEPDREGERAYAAQLADTLATLRRAAADERPAAAADTRETPAPRPRASGPAPDFDRQWNAIIGNEGGTGPHGEFLTSPAGAIGPAQVWPPTAPIAARLAGLPFDDHRYRTDRAYNIALGRAYYREMLRQFDGDPIAAAAAYNAGPGSARTGRGVRGAMERARRAGEPGNWVAYLPRETRAYVDDFRRRTGMAPDEGGAPVERAAGDGADPAALAEAEALAAERETLNLDRADGGPPVEPSHGPTLRQDLFADTAGWADAQRATWLEQNDPLPENAAPVAGNGAPGREKAAAAPEGRAAEIAPEAAFGAVGAAAEYSRFLDGHELRYLGEHGEALSARVTGAADLLGMRGVEIRSSTGRIARSEALAEGDLRALHEEAAYSTSPDAIEDLRERAIAARSENEGRRFSGSREIAQLAWLTGAPRPSEYFAERLGTSNWVVAPRLTKKLKERGLELAISPERSAELDAEYAAEVLRRAAPSAEPDLELAAPALAKFDDPGGEGTKLQAESLAHDQRIDAANDDAPKYRVDEDGEEKPLSAIIGELERQQAAADAIRGCLK